MKSLKKSLPHNSQIQLALFPLYTNPHGYLEQDLACQALFFYYLNAQQTYEQRIKENLVYEAELDSGVNLEQSFLSIARLYNVQPENMASYWPLVDKQCKSLQLPLLPDTWNYRFKSLIILH